MTLGTVRDSPALAGGEAREPGVVERDAESRRLAQGGGPQCRRLLGLTPDAEATGLQSRRDERLQSCTARVVDARLPRLDRPDADARSCGQVSLGQAGPATQPQDEVAKAL